MKKEYQYWPLNNKGELHPIIFDKKFIFDCIYDSKGNYPVGLIRKAINLIDGN